MPESPMPDVTAMTFGELLDSDDSMLRNAVAWIGAEADKSLPISAGGDDGGGAERVG
ncbi:hypothetical protein OKJ48_00915 [Streptomyces kunmingensis]|uniref:FXSXX-COOH protein n=1 Tax=Streptomyces kunmingensis TaxID=68225 RepID=A0ABU6C2A3_9ACTN|nr:hypothetical protein [Streptomyces kunmingensis]MEB3958825.1 hypothetical protein [Streptomyces kunmingensis]